MRPITVGTVLLALLLGLSLGFGLGEREALRNPTRHFAAGALRVDRARGICEVVCTGNPVVLPGERAYAELWCSPSSKEAYDASAVAGAR